MTSLIASNHANMHIHIIYSVDFHFRLCNLINSPNFYDTKYEI